MTLVKKSLEIDVFGLPCRPKTSISSDPPSSGELDKAVTAYSNEVEPLAEYAVTGDHRDRNGNEVKSIQRFIVTSWTGSQDDVIDVHGTHIALAIVECAE